MDDASILTAPPAEIRYKRRIGLISAIRELWRARELVRTLAERELRARYKQAILGFSWAIVTPVVMVVVFTLFFQRVAQVDTQGAPYALFAYLGLLPWTFFSGSMTQGGQSLLQNALLLNKVYCPREVFPLANVLVAGVDTLAASLALGLLFLVTQFAPQPTSLLVPLPLLVQVAFTLGATLTMSAAILYLRDLRHVLPIVLQLGLFVTPVAYGIDVVPRSLQPVYVAINPMAAVIDSYRRLVLWGEFPSWGLLAIAAATSFLLLGFGYWMFKRLETGFADVA